MSQLPPDIVVAGSYEFSNNIKGIDFTRILKVWEHKNRYFKPEDKHTAKYDHGRVKLTNDVVRFSKRIVEEGTAQTVVKITPDNMPLFVVDDLTEKFLHDPLQESRRL